MHKTKIVATLGPATNDTEIIKKLIKSGMNAARINFSHGTYETHTEIINKLVEAREALGAPVPLILDTKGPEIRIKTFKDGKITLEQGSTFTLTTEDVEGDENHVSVTYKNLPLDLKRGSRVLIDDGLVELRVKNLTETEVECQVVNGGVLGSRKGVNIPDVYVNLPSLTDKDIEDIKFGIEMGFDYIAASFIRSAGDVTKIRRILEENKGNYINIIAKIESRDGVNNIDEILEVADGIMVARGDLGVEIPPEEVPLVQKMLINKSNNKGKPVITATQMLESMVKNPRPTRAEANDVANAIFDGSDAIMLSGETAQGSYPIESVQMMDRIAAKTESSIDYNKELVRHHSDVQTTITNAISYATCSTAADIKAACIVAVTKSGFTARMLSKYRPSCPILVCTFDEIIWRQLSLVWGCVPLWSKEQPKSEEIFEHATKQSLLSGFTKKGDAIVIAAGVPVGITGTTNTLKVQIIGDVLVKGKGIGNKTVSGRASTVRVVSEAEKFFRKGDILVVPETNNDLIPYIKKASAIIVGSNTAIDQSHAEIVARALDIPVIICNERVVDMIPNEILITVDCTKGFVYNGILNKENNV